MIPLGMEYTSTAQGAALKQVKCAQCDHEYMYVLERWAEASESSFLFLDNEGAAQAAQENAQAKLQAKLRRCFDLVPCPECGWVQEEMLVKARSEYRSGLFWTGLIMLIACVPVGFVGIILNGLRGEHNPLIPWPWYFGLFACVPVGGLLLMLVKTIMTWSYEPNSDGERDKWRERGRARCLSPEQIAAILNESAPAPDEIPPEFIMFLHPEEQIRERLRKPEEFVDLVKAVLDAIKHYFAQLPAGPGFTLQVAYALLPGNKLLIEMQTNPSPQPEEILAGLCTELEKVPRPQAIGGPVAFATRELIWGGNPRGEHQCDMPFTTLLPPGWNGPLDGALLTIAKQR
jgi:hypothetical protein